MILNKYHKANYERKLFDLYLIYRTILLLYVKGFEGIYFIPVRYLKKYFLTFYRLHSLYKIEACDFV